MNYMIWKKIPFQMNNLIGTVDYGWGYGDILKFVKQQLPDISPTVSSLDARLTAKLAEYGGSRQPVWTDR